MITLTVNGEARSFDGDGDMPLLWYLRDELALTGTKYGCGKGLCGSCTVHMNGQAVRSCTTTMAALDGAEITTIEGLSTGGDHPLQVAWAEHDVPQCGYCQPGQIMQAASLLAQNPSPGEEEIRSSMQGVICRCGTYQRIEKAIKTVAGGES
ncbi:MAG: (2Fe-2S)-binding protein [Xanthomonadales bacterium]|jgi:aerobic-type carbon monoxide dehydrogenase small subunit (CoxS/CutS family)|nr:(2Fe-2S)-binding protein [Xanthomonadales bacterium]